MVIFKKRLKEIRKQIYYVKKYGIKSHLKFIKSNISEIQYLNSLYGKINYVLQINKNDKEFIEYKKYVDKLLKEKRA